MTGGDRNVRQGGAQCGRETALMLGMAKRKQQCDGDGLGCERTRQRRHA